MKTKQAIAALRKVGASKATGPALAAMYGQLISTVHAGKADAYIKHLFTFNGDDAVTARAKVLLNDRAAAWDVLMGVAK